MSGAYMNSMYTQIEKQFNIPASLVGIINGSFEIECEKEPGSLLWIFVMVGNIVRGMGETPIMPLGISYLEDFAKAENSPFYLACLHTATVIGPFLGLLLASFCAELFVDVGSVGPDFIPFLKALFRNPVYMLFICITVLQFSAFDGMISFMPKYLEQQFGKSASDAIFLIASGFSSQNASAILGQCDEDENCDKMLHYFLILSLVCSFIFSLAAMPGYMVLIRSLKPEEKSFGVGIHGLASRVFAGIPSPIYFGALIDTTCLKWGTMTCGGEGACRIYDIDTYRQGLSSAMWNNGAMWFSLPDAEVPKRSPFAPLHWGCDTEGPYQKVAHVNKQFMPFQELASLSISADPLQRHQGLKVTEAVGRPTYQTWRRKTMDRQISAGQLKEKPPFQDSDGNAVPDKTMCHNCSKLKIFLGALAFSFFAKGFSGSYMKSMTSQIERRFEISSSIVGIIDGSFEIGNLMVMVLVSYLGPRVHRPKIIAVGCLIMSLGAFLSVMPQFLMGRYNYERITVSVDNSTTSVSACSPASSEGHPVTDATETPSTVENVGLVRSSGMFGPTLGFLLGSFCASLWVDIGVVDTDAISINPKDTRWVGAWWLGLLICGSVNFIASLPFWFLPYSLPKEGENQNQKISHLSVQGDHCKIDPPAQPQLKFSEAVKDFLPALRKLFGNSIFLVYIFLTILQYNALVGIITYETKFMEQQFNVSVARAIFLIGVILLPITILGMFLGGFLIKKLKLHITEMAKFACITFIVAYLLNLLYFTCSCEVLQVAGLTTPYSGIEHLSSTKNIYMASCNADCSCNLDQWDPVCGDNGITYMTACFAGCKSSTGTGKNMQQSHFHGFKQSYLGKTIEISRSVSPDLKSFAVGIETLGGRVLGGLPAPIYFGALIDETCLKWGTKSCGGSGSCRVYDTKEFRNVYLGLIAGLRAGCCVLYIVLSVLIMKHFKPDGKEKTGIKNTERSTSKELDAANKKDILPGARTSEESEETCM
ncbi:hypothetical protein BTVI_153466 [Pitangus sulphuratus]|nr:hypothetical protein BTVI_153466 [Pitangus sulphuratus]